MDLSLKAEMRDKIYEKNKKKCLRFEKVAYSLSLNKFGKPEDPSDNNNDNNLAHVSNLG
jgi:hypothetical protein